MPVRSGSTWRAIPPRWTITSTLQKVARTYRRRPPQPHPRHADVLRRRRDAGHLLRHAGIARCSGRGGPPRRRKKASSRAGLAQVQSSPPPPPPPHRPRARIIDTEVGAAHVAVRGSLFHSPAFAGGTRPALRAVAVEKMMREFLARHDARTGRKSAGKTARNARTDTTAHRARPDVSAGAARTIPPGAVPGVPAAGYCNRYYGDETASKTRRHHRENQRGRPGKVRMCGGRDMPWAARQALARPYPARISKHGPSEDSRGKTRCDLLRAVEFGTCERSLPSFA